MEAIPDARSIGLGRAYTAIAEGPSGVWWNPGALGMPRSWEATFYTDVGRRAWIGGDLDVYAVAGPVRDVGLALHVVRVGEEDRGFGVRKKPDLLVQGGAGIEIAQRMGLADPRFVRWGVGGSLKLYRIGFEDDDEPGSRYRDHATDFDADAGSLLSIRVPLGSGADSELFPASGSPAVPFAGLRAGAIVRNALGHEIDLREGGGGFPLGTDARGGVAIEAGSAPLAPLGPMIAGTFSADLAGITEIRESNPMRSVGFELRLLDILSLRYGEMHSGEWKGITRGIGLQAGLPGRGGVRLDWAQLPFPCCSEETEQVTATMWVAP
jgi:hypothetical protein